VAKEITKPSADEMCPPGFHIVRGHERICHSGTKTWVDTHPRKNRGSVPEILLIENIHYLFWNSKKSYSKIKNVKQFVGKDQYDEVIQFWLDHWRSKGLPLTGFDPLLIKVVIAVESGFDPLAKSKVKRSSATGLMQITGQARGVLSGRADSDGYQEMKSDYLEVSENDMLDPIVNVATGIRWLAHKESKTPKGIKKTAHNTLKNYYSWNKDGEHYAKKIETLYKKSK
jgi:hypothetical protein